MKADGSLRGRGRPHDRGTLALGPAPLRVLRVAGAGVLGEPELGDSLGTPDEKHRRLGLNHELCLVGTFALAYFDESLPLLVVAVLSA